MPEGPEVQVITDNLQFLKGRKIQMIHKTLARPWVLSEDINKALNKEIKSIGRLGKFIIFDLEDGNKIVSHLSFTGQFKKQPDEYTAFILFLDIGKLFYSDKRGLGKFRYFSQTKFEGDTTLSKHKVDGLRDSQQKILNCLKEFRAKSKKELKPLLLDYSVVCGIGNIYGSEICFYSKISPFKKICDLTDEELIRVSKAIVVILDRAYQAGGSSIESFTDILSKPGHAQDYHEVYHKEICGHCGTRIKSVSQSGRTTFYCPKCQEVPDDNI